MKAKEKEKSKHAHNEQSEAKILPRKRREKSPERSCHTSKATKLRDQDALRAISNHIHANSHTVSNHRHKNTHTVSKRRHETYTLFPITNTKALTLFPIADTKPHICMGAVYIAAQYSIHVDES
jgi:hypothetical protein